MGLRKTIFSIGSFLMKEHLNNIIFTTISQILGERNQQALVIGGFVRDKILGRPSKDIDIVTLGSGIELAHETARRLLKNPKVTTYKNFGTAMFHYHGVDVEFVGARKESYNRNSRKPVVEDGTLDDDQRRRDFTINALAIDLHPERFGTLVDPFNGLDDLKNKIIRTPLDPDTTYSDDPLRMLRAIRFANQLDFRITDESIESITRNCERIKIISMERVADELNKIMLTQRPSIGIKLLQKVGLLAIIFPQLEALKGVDVVDGCKHKDNFYHTLEVLDNICGKSADLWLRWAALLHDIGKPITKKFVKGTGWTFHGHEFVGGKMIPSIFKNLKLPMNDKLKYVQKLVTLHMRPIVLVEDIVTDSAVRRLLFEAGDDIDDLMLLCDADITSKNPDKVLRFLDNYQLVRKKLVEVEEKDRVRNWQPPISGEVIIKTFALPPCQTIGNIKNAIKDAILDGVIENNYEAAYAFMIKKGEEYGLKPVE